MNVALWIVQALLAAAYLAAGGMKSTRPIESLSKSMSWVKVAPVGLVRFIGIAELLGGIGIVLPMVTGILPGLTVAAAVGLVVVQIFAAGFHASRGEANRLPMNLILLLLAAFVAYGRWVLLVG